MDAAVTAADPRTAAPPAHRTLASGRRIPSIGAGTFGSDRYDAETVGLAVEHSLRAGFRLLDCATVYGNEPRVGRAITDSGVPREELFVMSKIWNDAHEPAAAVASVERSLADLGLDVLDAVFVHWPFPNHHPPHAETDARDPEARPYEHAAFLRTWAALESLVDRGLVRHLGTSNVTIAKLERILADVRIAPALNEMELHPCFQQPELFRYCLDHDIQPIGYSPLGSPSRPERDRVDGDLVDIEHPAVQAIARERGVHPVVVCLAWAVNRGQIPIPFAVKPEQIEANLAAASILLTAAEQEALRGAERNNRLIKGQVFLWPGSTDWLDLWDADGTIPGWDGYGSPAL